MNNRLTGIGLTCALQVHVPIGSDNYDLKGEIMGTLPVLPKHVAQPGTKNPYITDSSLPSCYMSDYSLLGLLVDDYEKAVRALEENEFSMIEEHSGIEVAIDSEACLQKVFRVFKRAGIDCEIADIVDQVYQG